MVPAWMKIIVGLLIVGTATLLLWPDEPQVIEEPEEFHIHTDFKVFIEGIEYNFSQQRFMTDKFAMFREFVHLHDGDGEVIHFHHEDEDVVSFFRSLGLSLNNSCIVIDKENYCSDDDNTLQFFVNGEEIQDIESYIPQDLDRVLISYNSPNVSEELEQVTDKSCIQSGLCPERGDPYDESTCTTDGPCVIS